MSKNKKFLIALSVLIALLAGCIAGYIGYGSTMINPDNEKSVINYLSTDKNRQIGRAHV